MKLEPIWTKKRRELVAQRAEIRDAIDRLAKREGDLTRQIDALDITESLAAEVDAAVEKEAAAEAQKEKTRAADAAAAASFPRQAAEAAAAQGDPK